MTSGESHLAALSAANRQVLEGWLVEFDQSWADGRLAARVQQLPPVGHPLRLPALLEMVKIDIAALEDAYRNAAA